MTLPATEGGNGVERAKKEEMFCLQLQTPMKPEIDMGSGERQLTMVNATSKVGDIVQVGEFDVEDPGTGTILCCSGTSPRGAIVEAKCELKPASLLEIPNTMIRVTMDSTDEQALAQIQNMATILPPIQ